MEENSLFQMLGDLLGHKGEENQTMFHYLYGYARLLSMKPELVRNLLENERDLQEYENLRAMAERMNLDLDVLKTGSSLLMRQKSSFDMEAAVARATDGGSHVAADKLFREIMERNPEVRNLFVRGATIDDILNYKQSPVAAPRQEAAPKPEEHPKSQESPKPQETSTPETAAPRENEETLRGLQALLGGKAPAETAEPAETPQQPTPIAAQQRSFSQAAEEARGLYQTLSQFVLGQDEAVRRFVQGYFQSSLGLEKKENHGPSALFLFAGPPGVGKTYLATTAANQLGRPCLRLNMSEYASRTDLDNLIGNNEQFRGSREGKLTKFVREHPNAIVVLDEIEKADTAVIQAFLQILDAGVVQDMHTQKNVQFGETILIFTTNVGKKLYEDREENLSLLSQTVIMQALEAEKKPDRDEPAFPAAICSRFGTGNVVMFNHLQGRYLQQITQQHFSQQARAFQEKYGCSLELDPLLAPMFLFHMSSNLDARIISAQSSSFLSNELYEFSRLAAERRELTGLQSVAFRLQLPENNPEITELFVHARRDRILTLVGPELKARLAPLPADFVAADTAESLQKLAADGEYQMILIDPLFGAGAEQTREVFSLEDYDTEGVHGFHGLVRTSAEYPVYIADTEGRLSAEDRNTFCQMGARDVLALKELGQTELCAQLDEILEQLYLQEKLSELSGRGKVLRFNSAQSMSQDQSSGSIDFYDFTLETAVDADSRDSIMSMAEKPDVTFADIIGAENAKDELRFFVNYLRNPREYAKRQSRPAKGILLYGPPGTGKTMLAKAMAGEAGVTFLPAAGTDFIMQYVGTGEEKLRKLFSTARRYAPSVIFIDEIDAFGKERTGMVGSNHTETLLNALLTEMDGFSFDPKRPVFVMAATNFPISSETAGGKAVIDQALLRRFDNKICVDLPNKEERVQYLKLQLEKAAGNTVTPDTLENLAERTPGESLAILQNIISAAMRSAEAEGRPLDDALLLQAFEEYSYGEEHHWKQSYYESTAHHEAAHAYISWLSGVKPAFLTIVSRGNFGGYMQSESSEETPCYTKQALQWRIRTCLAGRAAEIEFYGEEAGINTGVSSDLQHATQVAMNMLCLFGMSGGSLLSLNQNTVLQSPMGASILQRAEQLLQEEYAETQRLVHAGREQIAALAARLLEKNQLTGTEILQILESGK